MEKAISHKTKISKLTVLSWVPFFFLTILCSLQVLAQSEHKIKDRKIDPKRANPRGDRESKENKKKIFVGKVDPSTTEETLRTYFEQFGTVNIYKKVELQWLKH